MNRVHSALRRGLKAVPTAGFTLVEIMLVVAIISLVLAFAVPSFLRARVRSQNADFMNAIRIYSDSAQLYAMEHSGIYPGDADSGILPDGMSGYIKQKTWEKSPPIGGLWDFERDELGITSAVGVHTYSADDWQVLEIDTEYDDGNLATGSLRKLGADRFFFIIQD